VKTRTIRQRVKFPSPPEIVYQALTSSAHHEAFTGAAAHFPVELGREMSAYGGYITGTVLGLFPGRGFVQTWRTTEWPDGCEDSRLEVILEPVGKGTRLTMIHSRLPIEFAPIYARGWRLHYWKPLRQYLEKRLKRSKKRSAK
jgi:uncharacterized protein YndB with AHSA1/START domain